MNKIAKNSLSANHGLEPDEVRLYRLLRLSIAPKDSIFMNSTSMVDLFKDHKNFKTVKSLEAKGYVSFYRAKNNSHVLEIIK